VKTIGGFAKNAERLARRNRLCRTGLATIASQLPVAAP
jgi:hypothetical protein